MTQKKYSKEQDVSTEDLKGMDKVIAAVDKINEEKDEKLIEENDDLGVKLKDNNDLNDKVDKDGDDLNDKVDKDGEDDNNSKGSDEKNDFLLAEKFIEVDPQNIHLIAQTNPVIADQLVAKYLGESHGIKSYAEFQKIQKDEQKDEAGLEARIKALEEANRQLQEKELHSYIESFRKENPDFKGEIEKETYNLFQQTNLSFSDAYEYVIAKHNYKKLADDIKNEVDTKQLSKKLASGFGGKSISSGNNGNVKKISKKERNFLELIGAKKTLKKYN